MKLLVITALFFSSLVPAFGAQPQDTIESRTAAAQRYAAVANMPKMLSDSFEAMSKNLPEQDRGRFLELTKKYVKPDALEKLSIEAMVKHFTTQELDALAKFYGSPEGQSAVAKFGVYMADILPLVQAEMGRAVQAMQEELKTQEPN